jgi:hypothetical protein
VDLSLEKVQCPFTPFICYFNINATVPKMNKWPGFHCTHNVTGEDLCSHAEVNLKSISNQSIHIAFK